MHVLITILVLVMLVHNIEESQLLMTVLKNDVCSEEGMNERVISDCNVFFVCFFFFGSFCYSQFFFFSFLILFLEVQMPKNILFSFASSL